MPPVLALVLTVAFCVVMLWRDSRAQRMRPGLWLPVIWICLIGSRFLSQWLGILGIGGTDATSLEDGSPLDAAAFLLLIGCGIGVLSRRKLRIGYLARENIWLVLFLLYCFLAITWSDFPFVAFKRWIKVVGHPVMALLILTEPDPMTALRKVFKRCAFFLLPFSILFIKYYPEFGRYFDDWSGMALNRGVNLNKNELGYSCMVFGLFFFWNILYSRRVDEGRTLREELALSLVFLAMVFWLFSMAGSASALFCATLGAFAMAVVGTHMVSHRYIGTTILLILAVVGWAELTFGIYGSFIASLGRDPTLTDRTIIWSQLLAFDINPVVGAGFESFWLGERLAQMWARWPWHPNQAHNGYIETYLNLGWLGVLLLVILLVVTFRKSRRALLEDFQFGRFRFGLLVAIILYNYTEASFKGVHLVWTMFYLIAIDYSLRTANTAQARSQWAVHGREHDDAVGRRLQVERKSPAMPQRVPSPAASSQEPVRQPGVGTVGSDRNINPSWRNRSAARFRDRANGQAVAGRRRHIPKGLDHHES